MAAEFAKSTMDRLRRRLDEEHDRLVETIENFERDREDARISVSPAEHNTDPDNVDGGSLVAELVKEISLEQNTQNLLEKVMNARKRMEQGTYGTCEVCGQHIPLARLEALPYVTTCVQCASAR